MSTATLVHLGNILITISAVEATLFVILYHFLAPWHRYVTGRLIMSLMMVIALILDESAVRIFTGSRLDTLWFTYLRLAVFCGVPVTIGWLTIRLIQLQTLARRPPEGDPSREDLRT